MSGDGAVGRPGGPQPLPRLTELTGALQQQRTQNRTDVPPVLEPVPKLGFRPILAPPATFDASEMITKVLALRVKMGDERLAASMKDVQHTGTVQKEKNQELAQKTADAQKKIEESKTGALVAKIFGWIAVGITVLAAIATGGLLAGVAAAVAVTMTVLSETGVMQKMTDAIAESLKKDQGMDDNAAKTAAGFITMAISIAVSLVTLGAGAAGAGAKVAEAAAKIATAAKFVQGAVTVAQASSQIYAGVKQFEAANVQADSAEIRKFQAKLQQLLDDEMDTIQAMIQDMNEANSRMLKILSGQTETSRNIISHMA
jgi:transloator